MSKADKAETNGKEGYAMAGYPINVHSEIGALKRVLVLRPGKELVNHRAEDFETVWVHDCYYLDKAQEEHDEFTRLMSERGAEVLYLTDLAAEAIEAHPAARAEFIDQVIAESGVTMPLLLQAAREKLEAIDDAHQLVNDMMTGYYVRDLELPKGVKTLAMLEGEGMSPVSLVLKPLPAAYFTRDPMASIGNGVTLNRMYWPQRNREVVLYQMVFKYHPDYAGTPLLYDHDSPWHIEGGDVLNINSKTLAIGISERTEAAAIDQLAQNLFWGEGASEIEQIYAIKIPHGYAYMHLDTVFTQVDYDKFTVYPGIFDTLRVYRLTKGDAPGEVGLEQIEDTLDHILEMATGQDSVQLIECGGGDPIEASREQWNDGSNTLALAPGVTCVYERNVVTNDALYKAGIDLVVMPSEELSRGRGGPRCMSMPFWREEI